VVPYSMSSVDGNVTLRYDLSVEKRVVGFAKQDILFLGKCREE
jgi:hypothetical protein